MSRIIRALVVLLTVCGAVYVTAAYLTFQAPAMHYRTTPKATTVQPKAINTILSAPAGSCVNNDQRFGCAHASRIVLASSHSRRNAQCEVYALEPQRSGNWVHGTALTTCVGGAQDEGVWAELKMWAHTRNAWITAAVTGTDKINRDGITRETAWSRCTGAWGTFQSERPWETRAHGFYTINNTLYLKTVRSQRDTLKCVHNVG